MSKKFEIIEEGFLTQEEMKRLKGGICTQTCAKDGLSNEYTVSVCRNMLVSCPAKYKHSCTIGGQPTTLSCGMMEIKIPCEKYALPCNYSSSCTYKPTPTQLVYAL
jgi:hypothetical protein